MPGVPATMSEFKRKTLKSSSGQTVTNRKQAIAIGMSQQRRQGGAPAVSAQQVRGYLPKRVR